MTVVFADRLSYIRLFGKIAQIGARFFGDDVYKLRMARRQVSERFLS